MKVIKIPTAIAGVRQNGQIPTTTSTSLTHQELIQFSGSQVNRNSRGETLNTRPTAFKGGFHFRQSCSQKSSRCRKLNDHQTTQVNLQSTTTSITAFQGSDKSDLWCWFYRKETITFYHCWVPEIKLNGALTVTSNRTYRQLAADQFEFPQLIVGMLGRRNMSNGERAAVNFVRLRTTVRFFRPVFSTFTLHKIRRMQLDTNSYFCYSFSALLSILGYIFKQLKWNHFF